MSLRRKPCGATSPHRRSSPGRVRATFEPMIFNVEAWTALMAGQPGNGQRDDRSLAALSDRHERRLDSTFVDQVDVR